MCLPFTFIYEYLTEWISKGAVLWQAAAIEGTLAAPSGFPLFDIVKDFGSGSYIPLVSGL